MPFLKDLALLPILQGLGTSKADPEGGIEGNFPPAPRNTFTCRYHQQIKTDIGKWAKIDQRKTFLNMTVQNSENFEKCPLNMRTPTCLCPILTIYPTQIPVGVPQFPCDLDQ